MFNLSDIPVPAVSRDGSDVLPGVLLDQPSPHCCLTPLQFQALFSKTFSLVQRQAQVSEEKIAIILKTYLKFSECSPKFSLHPLCIPMDIVIKGLPLAKECCWYKVDKLWPMLLRLILLCAFGS